MNTKENQKHSTFEQEMTNKFLCKEEEFKENPQIDIVNVREKIDNHALKAKTDLKKMAYKLLNIFSVGLFFLLYSVGFLEAASDTHQLMLSGVVMILYASNSIFSTFSLQIQSRTQVRNFQVRSLDTQI